MGRSHPWSELQRRKSRLNPLHQQVGTYWAGKEYRWTTGYCRCLFTYGLGAICSAFTQAPRLARVLDIYGSHCSYRANRCCTAISTDLFDTIVGGKISTNAATYQLQDGHALMLQTKRCDNRSNTDVLMRPICRIVINISSAMSAVLFSAAPVTSVSSHGTSRQIDQC